MARRSVTTRNLPINISVPAGTTAIAPKITLPMPTDVILQSVTIRIPPGHAGLTGIRVDYASTTIVPWSNPSQWITDDDQRYDFQVGIEVGDTLQLVTFNTDVVAHSFFGFLVVSDLTAPAPTPTTLVPIVA